MSLADDNNPGLHDSRRRGLSVTWSCHKGDITHRGEGYQQDVPAPGNTETMIYFSGEDNPLISHHLHFFLLINFILNFLIKLMNDKSVTTLDIINLNS